MVRQTTSETSFSKKNSKIIILDFGGQYCHLIARRVRELGVYSEILPYNCSLEKIQSLNPVGIILSGGPSSVYSKNAPKINKTIFNLKIPILGICYGQQLIGALLGGEVKSNKIKEYGKKIILIKHAKGIFKGLKKREQVWMSHGDEILSLPEGFISLASTNKCKNAAIVNIKRRIYGVQFHPEVIHTINGMKIIKNFIYSICKAKNNFDIKSISKKIIKDIKVIVKDDGVLMGISGGVDSTVAGVLINKAIGKNFHGIFIDHGMMRKDEMKKVKSRYDKMGLNVKYVDASNVFLRKLKNITDPEHKRKIIGGIYGF